MSSFSLDGKVALVTGGARGIGFAIADAMVQAGAAVALLDIDAERVGSAASKVGALALPCDLRDTAAVDASIARITDELGGLDVVVNNAGASGVFLRACRSDGGASPRSAQALPSSSRRTPRPTSPARTS